MAEIIFNNVNLIIPFVGESRFFNKENSPNFSNKNILGAKKIFKNNRTYSQVLDNVSFNCHDGDNVGLLGHNGSGKTSLIRLIAGIYKPTDGDIKINGKMSALINVGPMLEGYFSGYENIKLFLLYFNQSIDLSELTKNVEKFSELGEFLHLPIKKYSSGMQTRLVFALSVFIKPEIQLTDEGFATGDAYFNKKSEVLLKEYYDSAKIKIYASHDLNFLKLNCNKIFLMRKGKLKTYTDVNEAIEDYISDKYNSTNI